MIDDRVDRDRRLAGRTVADDQFALAFADRDERVDRANAGLERLLDGLALHDRGSDVFDRAKTLAVDRTFAVDRLAERVHDPAQQRIADRNRRDAAGPANEVAFLDAGVGAHDDHADVVLFEVERDALHPVGELDQLRRADAAQSVDAREVGAHFDHGTDFVFANVAFERRDLLFEDSGDFVCVNHPILLS